MRTAATLLFGLLAAGGLWFAFADKRLADRAVRGTVEPPRSRQVPEPPADPNAFVVWWNDADEAARDRAIARLKQPGPHNDARIVALIDADVDASEVFKALADRTYSLLKEICLRPTEKPLEGRPRHQRREAFGYAMMIAAPEEQSRLVLACMARPVDPMHEEVADWLAFYDHIPFPVNLQLRRALARALADAPPPEMNFWGPGPLHVKLFDALSHTLDNKGRALRDLATDEDPVVRAVGAGMVSWWVGDRRWTSSDTDEEERQEREVEIPRRAKAAVGLLVPLLSDPEADVRNAAIRALARIGKEGAPVPADALLARLADPSEDSLIRGLAALARTRLADNATADLLPFLKDPDKAVRASATRGIAYELDRDHPDPALLAHFVSALEDAEPDVRVEAAHGLGRYAGSPDAQCRELLAAGLDDPSEAVRVASARALNQFDAPAVEALAHAQRWLAGGSVEERNAAISVAVRLKARAAPLEQALAPLVLVEELKENRQSVLRALQHCARLDTTLEILLRFESIKDGDVRRGAVETLAARFIDRPRAQDALVRALDDANTWVMARAAQGLAARRLATPKVLRTCVNLIWWDEGGFWSKEWAIEILVGYGVEARPIVPMLLKALDHPEKDDRAILNAFGQLPALAEQTVPPLVRRFARGDRRALVALVKMKGAAQPYLDTALGKLETTKRKEMERAIKQQREAFGQTR